MTALDAQVLIMGREMSITSGRWRKRRPVTSAPSPTTPPARKRCETGYAGSDFFLAPSTFEPCGLGPLIALRYGSIPIARRTGGLAETITDHTRHPESSLGFTFARRTPGPW